ncbi:hypothetical protein O3G_MSEX012746 [Manduca sexta]|uniref:DUF3730 domain-containing protein n=1 Tax=Manduca sexta TaxID=7130 RepID=A0A921ZPE8_MANSE|nr:hypothetical protein O3G_MSEX012746 [Manduca sexta]
MDEIEYKLNANNSVLVVNAIDKLISTIKSNFKLEDRQRFVLENEELKYLREKCSSKDAMVSLTACQGLLALVELGVLEIAHTMSTVVTLLPAAHNYLAIISTMAGLLILDLKSRLIPGQPYKCQFSLKSPQHPFITVLEKNKGAADDVLAQMHALCTHPDYTVSSNSLELLRPVFLWLTCNPQRDGGIRPWQLMLSLPQTSALSSLLLACLSCQQICNPSLIERAFSAYSAVTDAAVYQQNREMVMALLPMLARVSNELVRHGRDPRPCYVLMERCIALDAAELRAASGLVLMTLADNLLHTSALHLHELFNLCLNIISRYECPAISLDVFVALTLQWLNLPSHLTSSALKVAAKILDTYQEKTSEDTRLHTPNMKVNKTFQALLYTDSRLSIIFKLNEIWERMRDDPEKLKFWLNDLEKVDDGLKKELLPFLFGIIMGKRNDQWYEEIAIKALAVVTGMINTMKDVSVQLLPILVYKIAHDKSPKMKLECLKALPLMAKTKENVPTVVSILNKLKANKGVPTSFLIMLYASLADNQVRCFPYLREMLVDTTLGRPDDLKWEIDIARATAVLKICETRPSPQGLELVGVISSTLNRCGDKPGGAATRVSLAALAALWRGAAVAPPGAWRALEPKLGRDSRPIVQIQLCKLLGEVPSLRVSTPEYDCLVTDACRRLWAYIADSNHPEVIEAACDALAGFRVDDYKLKDIPEIYRRTVKLPPSHCKTPADAARKPEDVLDYVPCEVWPEVFKYTNQAALQGVIRLTSRLIEREIKGYRSGVYQLDVRQEPLNLGSLPPSSVVRGLLECFRKQATSPSYDYTDTILLAILQTLSAEYPRPIPPVDLCFLPEIFHRGPQWKAECVKFAARQASVSPSARRILENYLQGVASDTAEEEDVVLVFDFLPILCRSMPPNSLREPIERRLGESFTALSKVKGAKDPQEFLFVRQLDMIRKCLECDKIHVANRTLLSQIVENYFSVISDDNLAWPMYVQTCRCLSTKYLERMTSPSGWWEVSGELLRKSTTLRSAVAAEALVWLHETIDAHATHLAEQEFSLQCMVPALQAAEPDGVATREWFLQLMARTQVAFKETEDESSKLYLCDVFTLSVIVFSGYWSLQSEDSACRSERQALLPAAVAALLARDGWSDCTLQMLEWLWHTRDSVRDVSAQLWCQRALLAARHTRHFAQHRIWTKLESHFGRDIIDD